MNTVTVTETKNEVTVNETTNTVTVQEGVATVVTVKTEGPQGQTLSDGDKGDVTVSSNGTAVAINTGAVTSAKILDGTIVNSDINASASIQGTKISPNFGSQTITTTGIVNTGVINASSATDQILNLNSSDNGAVYLALKRSGSRKAYLGYGGTGSTLSFVNEISDGDINISGNDGGSQINVLSFDVSQNGKATFLGDIATTGRLQAGTAGGTDSIFNSNLRIENTFPTLYLNDSDTDNDFYIRNSNGTFNVHDVQASVNRFTINSSGTAAFSGNLNVGGLVDGRDIALDGTKLDGIEANAINASNAAITNKLPLTGGTMTGDLTLSGTVPKVIFNDTDGTNGYRLIANAGGFKIQDTSNSNATRFTVQANGNVLIDNTLVVEGNLLVNGTTTTINSATVNVDDKNFVLNAIDSPTDALANNGGFTLKGDTDKTFQWINATDSWTSSEHIALPDSKKLQLGSLQDLQLYHQPTTSSYGGVSVIASHGMPLAFKTNLNGNTEDGIVIYPNNRVELYYDNSKKIETSSTGASVTGQLGIGTTSPARELSIHSPDSGSTYLQLTNTTTGTTSGDGFGIGLSGNEEAKLWNYENTNMQFATNNQQRLKITSDGNIQIPANNRRLQIGANQELEIFRSDNHSSILDNLQSSILSIGSQRVNIVNGGNTEVLASFRENAQAELYYDNSKKFETTSGGVSITGNHLVSGGYNVTHSGSAVLQLFSSASSFTCLKDLTDDLRIRSDKTTIMNEAQNETLAKFIANGGVELYHDNHKTAYTFDRGLSINGSDTSNWTALNVFGNSGQDATILLRSNAGAAFADNWRIYAQSSDKAFYIRNFAAAAYETNIKAVGNGTVELYFDNSKKFETTSAGATVTGKFTSTGSHGNFTTNDYGHVFFQNTNNSSTNFWGISPRDNGVLDIGYGAKSGTFISGDVLTLTTGGNIQIPSDSSSDANGRLQIGASQDLQIYHDGSNTFIKNNTGFLAINSDNYSIRDKNDGDKFIQALHDGAVELYYDNARKIFTTATGTQISCGSDGDGLKLEGTTNRIDIVANSNRGGAANTILELDAHWNNTSVAFIALGTGDDTTNKDDGRLRFFTKPSGGTITERLKIEPDGNVQIPNDSGKLQLGTSQDLEIFHDGSVSRIKDVGTGGLFITTDSFNVKSTIGEDVLKGIQDGAVELYFNGVKKLETTSTGATVTTTSAANSIKNITTSTSQPSGGSDGDLWFTYVA